MINSEQKFYKQAYSLSLFTIFYNIIEGIVSMALGYADETLSLFGFDSLTFNGNIWYMIFSPNPASDIIIRSGFMKLISP